MRNQQTLSRAVDVLLAELSTLNVVLTADSMYDVLETYGHGMNYNEQKKCDVPIASLKGKNTKKWCHFVIERLDSGLYEPIVYCL